jgi:hypothetical protein
MYILVLLPEVLSNRSSNSPLKTQLRLLRPLPTIFSNVLSSPSCCSDLVIFFSSVILSPFPHSYGIIIIIFFFLLLVMSDNSILILFLVIFSLNNYGSFFLFCLCPFDSILLSFRNLDIIPKPLTFLPVFRSKSP